MKSSYFTGQKVRKKNEVQDGTAGRTVVTGATDKTAREGAQETRVKILLISAEY